MSSFDAEIIAIDETTASGGVDIVGWLESATTFGEINFTSVDSFVDNVLAELGSRKMSLLHIQVHGSPQHVRFGRHYVRDDNFDTYRARFSRLAGKFSSGAWVDLRACNVGQNLPLLRRFHSLWNTGIVAGRGNQNNLFDANFGRYQVIHPDGREDTSFFVPAWVKYDTTRRGIREVTSRF